MTNNEVLEKAIQKAIDGGWVSPHRSEHVEIIYDDMFEFTVDSKPTKQYEIHELIYSHDFAKALWGETEVHHYDLVDLDNGGKTEIVNKPRWCYHLQQMVVAEDPLQYLKENI